MALQCAEFLFYWMKYTGTEIFIVLCTVYQRVGAVLGNDECPGVPPLHLELGWSDLASAYPSSGRCTCVLWYRVG